MNLDVMRQKYIERSEKASSHQESYPGWLLSSCCGSVAEHWRLKPEVSWVRFLATASFFTFLYFCLITSKFCPDQFNVFIMFLSPHCHIACRHCGTTPELGRCSTSTNTTPPPPWTQSLQIWTLAFDSDSDTNSLKYTQQIWHNMKNCSSSFQHIHQFHAQSVQG